MEALMLETTLTVGDDGCVSAGDTTLVWPAGYSVRGDTTSFLVIDGDGNVIARSDQSVEIGGGGVDMSDEAWGNVDCVSGDIWMVGDIVTP
jgi:hypothetical protein